MAKKTAQKPAPVTDPTPESPITTTTTFNSNSPLWALIPAVLALVVFAASLSNGFVFFDDDKAILYNKAVLHPSFASFFSGENLGMFAPITWIAYWIGNMISPKEAYGAHLLGLIFHALNAALVFMILKNITQRHLAALVAAVFFAVHPIQAEAVCWAAALSTVLFSTGYLLSILAYLRWTKREKPIWLAISLITFIVAVLAKSAAITLPFVLLAIDFYQNSKLERKYWLSKIFYLLISFGAGLYTIHTREIEGHNIEAASSVYSALDRFWMICQTILFYPVKLLAPFGYSVAYPFVKMNGSWDWTYYAAPLVLVGLGVLLWKKFATNKTVLLGVALYILPLSIMLPIRTVGSFELRSDRYVYISCIGLFFLIGLLLEKLQKPANYAVIAVLTLFLGWLGYQQSDVWKDGVSLFENCVDKTPESSLCQCNLAYNQLINKNFEGAVTHYSEALKYDQTTIEAYNGRGQAYLFLGQVEPALNDFGKAIAAGISTPKLYFNRGQCLLRLGRPAEALPDFSKSLELEPKSAETWYYRGSAQEKTGSPANALTDYSKAIELNPNYVEALVNRGFLKYNGKDFDSAIADYSSAQKIAIRDIQPMILVNRANAYYQSGQYDQAIKDATAALELSPKNPRALQVRGACYLKMGQVDKGNADLKAAQQ